MRKSRLSKWRSVLIKTGHGPLQLQLDTYLLLDPITRLASCTIVLLDIECHAYTHEYCFLLLHVIWDKLQE
jgi:hypothetical protein